MNTKNFNELGRLLEQAFWVLLGAFGLIILILGRETNPESVLADAFARPSLGSNRSPWFFVFLIVVLSFAMISANLNPPTSSKKSTIGAPRWAMLSCVLVGVAGVGFAATPELPWGWILGLEFSLLGFVYFISTFLESPS